MASSQLPGYEEPADRVREDALAAKRRHLLDRVMDDLLADHDVRVDASLDAP